MCYCALVDSLCVLAFNVVTFNETNLRFSNLFLELVQEQFERVVRPEVTLFNSVQFSSIKLN